MSCNFPKFWKGYVKIRMQSDEPERFLRICIHKGIPIWNLRHDQGSYEMEVFAKDFFTLASLRKKTGSHIRLIKKQGLPFFLNKNKKRKAFFLGIFLACFLLFLSSLYIWDVQITGNHHYSRETILEVLQESDIDHGVRKSTIDCKQLAASLRSAFPDIVWVSARIEGTCLLLELKENEDSYRMPGQKETGTETEELLPGSDLLAPESGILTKIVTRAGMPLMREGETCKKGDVLVKGMVEILDQNGETARQEKVIPDADIQIFTSIPYSDTFPLEHTVKNYQEEKVYPMFKILGKELIAGILPSSEKENQKDHEQEEWEIQKTEKNVYLTPTFCLPVAYGYVTCRKYFVSVEKYTKEEAYREAEKRLVKYMKQLVSEGIRIENKNITIQYGPKNCFSKGMIYIYLS